MEQIIIEYQGKDYYINELDIDTWNKLNILNEVQDENEFMISVINIMTGIDTTEIRKAPAFEINKAVDFIKENLMHIDGKFYNEFVFNNTKYKFIDIENLTFGEFIDIDSFLQKSDIERKSQMNELMALLYREVDDNGVLVEYDATKIRERIEEFKKLPVRYLQGASTFFFSLENILSKNTHLSLVTKTKLKLKVMRRRLSTVFGAGMVFLYTWLKKIFSRLMKSLNYRYWWH